MVEETATVFQDFLNHTPKYKIARILSGWNATSDPCTFEVEDKTDGNIYFVKCSIIQLKQKGKNGVCDLDIGKSNILFESRFALLANHPNILKAKEVIVGSFSIFIIMPKYRCTLDELLIQNNLSIARRVRFVFQIASAVYYMHSNGFVHCDVKPQNILVDANTDNVVLCDFGLSGYAEDISMNKAFQSLAYRPPEHISLRDMKLEAYREDFGLIQKIDYRLSELWSLGLVCLEIVYNTHGIVFSKAIQNHHRFTQKKYSFSYEKFIDILSMLHRPDKHASVAKFKNSYELLKNIFGRVAPELDPMLKMICDFFFPLELYKRSLHSFVSSSYFLERRYKIERIPFIYPDVISMYVPPNESAITRKETRILVEWLFDISGEYKIYPIVLLNTIDYIIQRSDVLYYFDITIQNYQLFGACVFWIMTRLLNFDFFINLSELRELCCDHYSFEDFTKMIQRILSYEKGYFYFDCVYNYLPSEELMEKALRIVSNVDEYLLYPNPKKLALSLLQKETIAEISNRTPKHFREYHFFERNNSHTISEKEIIL